MKLVKIAPNIYHVKFATTYDMCSTLMRFSEFYENPVFKNKVIELDTFKKWYRQYHKKKIFTYNRDWTGFNIPVFNIKKFSELNELNLIEQKFISLLKGISKNAYIIATSKSSESSVFKHEMAHAVFETNKKYRSIVSGLVTKHIYYNKIVKYLKKSGYHKGMYVDEAHAYTLENYSFVERHCSLAKNSLKDLSIKLNEAFKRYEP